MTRKHILLLIAGGVAAYKSLELIRRLRDYGHTVRCVMTSAAQQFITPLSVASLSQEKVYTSLFDLKDESEMGHITLSRQADLVVVCPATANLMAKFAHGIADDLATTLLLATDKPVIMVPAMNVRMWLQPATQRNIATLQHDGVTFIGPIEGDMACGEFGAGRLSDIPDIIQAIQSQLETVPARTLPLTGKKILITAGATREPIDPVRYLSNLSSGKQGYALAEAALKLGAMVTLVSSARDLPPPVGAQVVMVDDAQQMLDACLQALPCDVALCCAAVADFRPQAVAPQKIKKGTADTLTLTLVRNPDILATLGQHPLRPQVVVGFAAETENLLHHATQKRLAKRADLIVANDVSHGAVFGKDETQVVLISDSEAERWPPSSKKAVAERLMSLVASRYFS